jgi:hypothetical protein
VGCGRKPIAAAVLESDILTDCRPLVEAIHAVGARLVEAASSHCGLPHEPDLFAGR